MQLPSESNEFTYQNIKTVYYSLLSMKHLAQQMQVLGPQGIRKCKTLNKLKTKIKS